MQSKTRLTKAFSIPGTLVAQSKQRAGPIDLLLATEVHDRADLRGLARLVALRRLPRGSPRSGLRGKERQEVIDRAGEVPFGEAARGALDPSGPFPRPERDPLHAGRSAGRDRLLIEAEPLPPTAFRHDVGVRAAALDPSKRSGELGLDVAKAGHRPRHADGTQERFGRVGLGRRPPRSPAERGIWGAEPRRAAIAIYGRTHHDSTGSPSGRARSVPRRRWGWCPSRPRTGCPSAGTSREAVVGAFGPVVAACGAAGALHSIESIPFPIGAPIAIVLVGYLAYRGVRVFREWAESPPAPRPTPYEADATLAEDGRPPPAPSSTRARSGRRPPVRSSCRDPRPGVPPATAAARAAVPREPTIWTPMGGERPVRLPALPVTVSTPPPPSHGFAQTLAIEFAAIVTVLLFAHAYLFAGINRIVQLLGTLIYWPLPWPGLVANASLRRSLPDLIFVVYLALMLAFCLASGLFSDPSFTERQRRYGLIILGAYTGIELLIDVVFFTIGDRFLDSAFLLIRGMTGGAFFMALLLATLIYPAPIALTRRWPRAKSAIFVFAASIGLSVVLAVALLYVLYHSVGLGRDLVPFAVLLLIPVTALTIWGAVGRILYDRELYLRPVPDVETYHPRVSIIIPAYNEEAGIAAAIRSADVAAGLYPGDTEIIVGNDGSADATVARAREAIVALRHATGAVLDLPHGGKSNALNGALSAATGEIVVRIDADARISTTLGFGAMVTHFADPEVGGVQGLILPLQQEGWTRKLRFLEIAWNHLYLRRAMMATRSAQVVDGAFCAFRRADLDRLGGWVAWNGEDTEITLRLQRMGYRTRFETAAAAFEDVPSTYASLRSQRIRWNRGGLFAHRRHMGGLFSDAPEFGALAMLLWFGFFVRGGLRTLIWVYAILLTVLLGLPTILDVALIAAILLIPRGVAIGYYLVKYGRWQILPYIAMWPVAGSIKQFFALESYGSMLPGASPEFAE